MINFNEHNFIAFILILLSLLLYTFYRLIYIIQLQKYNGVFVREKNLNMENEIHAN